MKIILEKVAVPLALALISACVLYMVRVFAFRVFHRWAKRTETDFDNIVINGLKTPSFLWCVAVGIYTGIAFSELPSKYVFYSNRLINILIILSMTIATANLAGRLLRSYVKSSQLPIPTTGLVFGIIKGVIIIVGVLIILSVLGISITPLITALGVGGLAVALALQDTLANLFAGMHILMEKSVRIGDFIKLENNQEGFVEDIGWRTTRMRMLANNMVIIPNGTLAKSIVTNYNLPENRMSLLIPVSVSYASSPEKVEDVLTEEAKAAATEIPGLLKEPEPFVRFIPGFGNSSLDFTLICQIKEFVDQYLVQHELRKRIFRRLQKEGIEIPYPHRTVYLREEKQWKE